MCIIMHTRSLSFEEDSASQASLPDLLYSHNDSLVSRESRGPVVGALENHVDRLAGFASSGTRNVVVSDAGSESLISEG